MKIEWNSKYTTIAIYSFLTIGAVILLFLGIIRFNIWFGIVLKILAILSPFFYAFAISYVMNPVEKRLNLFMRKIFRVDGKKKIGNKVAHKKTAKTLSILLTYVFLLLCITIFFLIVIPQIILSITDIVSDFPSYMNTAKDRLNVFFTKTNLPTLQAFNTRDDLMTFLDKGVALVTKYSPMLINLFSSIANEFKNFILGLIISIYMLIGKEKFSAQLKKLLFALFGKEKTAFILEEASTAHVTFGGFVTGQLLDSLLVGILCFIGMTILQLPYPFLIAVIIGATNIIPFFGPFFGAIPSIFLIFFVSPMGAVWFSVFILILQQLDGNFISPKILGRTTGLPAFWIIFSLLLMGGLFGVIGMLIAVPLFSLVYTAVKRSGEKRLMKKGMPIETAYYNNKEDILH